MVAVLLLLGFLPIVNGELLGKLCFLDSPSNTYYHHNLLRLSATLPNATSSSPYLFAKSSMGASPDTIYSLALCRGDANTSACGDCINAAFETMQQECNDSRETVVFYDMCLLSLSDQDFIDIDNYSEIVYGVINTMNTTEPKLPGWNPSNASRITEIIRELLVETSKPAAYVYIGRRYVTAFMDATANNQLLLLYSMAQCTPDLTSVDCWTCLTNITEIAMASFVGQQRGGVLTVRCVLRYDTNVFYSGMPMWFINPAVVSESAPLPSAVPSLKHTRRVSKVLVISVVVPLFAAFFCLIVSLGLIRRRKKALNERVTSNPEFGFIPRQRKGKGPHDKAKMNVEGDETLVWEIEGRVSEFKVYDFSQVMEATSNFSERNKLGRGGFGPVYKGELPDGLDIAVKRLASRSVQGFTEFKNEIELIAKLQHRNLVRLLGCCCQGEEKILIYEYLPNKSLDFFIFDPVRKYIINWTKRLAIIEGIAQGMLYLHKHSRLRVIHRDLKASNILLDHKMNPKISDFGLAKIFSTNDTEGNTERIAGTFGYMAPEYASEGLFSIKSDVFSFGVLLLEIISGKRTSRSNGYGDFINLLGHLKKCTNALVKAFLNSSNGNMYIVINLVQAWQLWKNGLWLQLVDASLATKRRAIEIKRCINIALLCVQENAADRPIMAQVVAMLSSESVTLLEPKHPAYFHIRVGNEDVSTFIEPSSSKDVTALDGK